MKPTALMEAIKWVESKLALPCFNQEHLMENEQWEVVLDKLKSLLPKDRQDIEEAYEDGQLAYELYPKKHEASDYFNQNFTQDITNQVK